MQYKSITSDNYILNNLFNLIISNKLNQHLIYFNEVQ